MEWKSVAAYPVQEMYLRLVEEMGLDKIQQRESMQGALILCQQFGYEVTTRDIKGKNLIPRDKQGRRVRVIASEYMPYRVWASDLDYDIFVFCRQNRNGMYKFHGWSDVDAVDEAPVWWWMKNGERRGFAHEIEVNVMWPMPETFDFTKDCEHGFGIWKDWPGFWECFICGRNYDSASQREWVKSYVPKPRRAAEVLPAEDAGEPGSVGQAGE